MPRRIKRLAIICSTLGVLLAILINVSRVLFLDSFASLEKREMTGDISQVRNILNDYIQQINTTNGDYSGWDEAYRFVQDGDPEFVRVNLSNTIFPRLRLNLIAFFSADGRAVYAKAFDYRKESEIPLPKSLQQHLAPSSPLLRLQSPDSSVNGILLLKEGPMLITSRPVLSSQYRGPVMGTLVMGRFFDEEEQKRLARSAMLSLSVQRTDNALPPGYEEAGKAFAAGAREHVQVADDSIICGYGLCRDIYGRDALIFKINGTRSIYQEGSHVVDVFFFWSLGIGLVSACVIFFLLEKIIAQREQTDKQLRQAKEELEIKVAERTAQLKCETAERLLAMEELREKDRLLMVQSRQAAMGEMIGNIAHQWRQPLNTLGLVIQDLIIAHEQKHLSGEYLEDSVSRAMQMIFHMSQTIDDFRFFFKPNKEKREFRLEDVIRRSVSLIEACLKEHGIDMTIEGQDRVINGYPNEFSQVLLNILINARDALTERGAENPQISIKSFPENDDAVVTVIDNAGGITADIIDRVFDPYFTTKGPDHGMGLGLFMSKLIIEKNMGGSLTVRNRNGGAEFRIVMKSAGL